MLDHTSPTPDKPQHSVFNVQGDGVLALVDEAWMKRVMPVPNNPQSYAVNMGGVPPNREDWPELSGSLREGSNSAAAALKGEGPINFGMGTFNREQVRAMGEAWDGPGYRVTSRGYYESVDGLRQFTPPSTKPNSQFATTGVQANFEQRLVPSGAWGSNGHVNVTP